ncbi:MAG TPA: hypothetical protein VGJ31_04715 [Dongiaceae bacterium]
MPNSGRLLAIIFSWILGLLAFGGSILGAAGLAHADQPGVMAMPGEACATPPVSDWTEPEKWAWGRICTGEVADMADHTGGSDEPATSDDWPAGRDLSLRFLETILLVEPYRSAVPILGVRIHGAHFAEFVNLSNASLIRELWLDNSRFDRGADMLSLHSNGSLSLEHSWFGGPLDLQRSQIDGSLFMKNVVTADEISMTAAKIASILDLTAASVGGDLDLSRLSVNGDVILTSSEEHGALNISGSHLGNKLDFNGAHIAGDANLQRLTLASTLFAEADKAGKRTRFDGGLDMLGAVLSGSAEFIGASARKELILEQASIAGYLWLAGDDDQRGDFVQVDLVGAHIGSGILIHQADFHGKVRASDIHVGQSVEINSGVEFFRAVEMIRARIEGDFDITRTTFDGPVDMKGLQVGDDLLINQTAEFDRDLNLVFARIGQSLDFTNGTFAAVDLTGATIGSEIRLASQSASPPKWNTPRTLILRNVSAGALQDVPTSWPDEIDLEGFTYMRLGGAGAPVAALGERATSEFTDLLEKQKAFSPQSYMQLATVFRNSGYADKADWILFKGKLRELDESIYRPDRFLFLFIYCITTGFGIYPQLAALWVILLVVIGTFIFGRDKRRELSEASWFDRAIYSLDMLIPVIHLRKSNYEFEPASTRARYYLYFHRLAGFLLASVLIASMTHGGVELHG